MQRLYLLAATLLILGCQQASAPLGDRSSPSEPATVSAAAQLKAEGDALMAAGDHRAAADRYRRAVKLEPNELSLRFALATAYTFLDSRPEAVEQFRFVVKRGDPGSVEYREARRWLGSVGIKVESEPAPAAVAAVGPGSPVVGGRLVGSAEWPGIDPAVRSVPGQLSIEGIEGATETVKRSRPLRLGGRFNFYDIPPGQYRIVALMNSYPKDVTLWDQKVTVADGKLTELVLTSATALIPPDKFPPPPK